MDYFERLAQDAYLLARKFGPLDEQLKIQEEQQKVPRTVCLFDVD